jgi:hypothetical protein
MVTAAFPRRRHKSMTLVRFDSIHEFDGMRKATGCLLKGRSARSCLRIRPAPDLRAGEPGCERHGRVSVRSNAVSILDQKIEFLAQRGDEQLGVRHLRPVGDDAEVEVSAVAHHGDVQTHAVRNHRNRVVRH